MILMRIRSVLQELNTPLTMWIIISSSTRDKVIPSHTYPRMNIDLYKQITQTRIKSWIRLGQLTGNDLSHGSQWSNLAKQATRSIEIRQLNNVSSQFYTFIIYLTDRNLLLWFNYLLGLEDLNCLILLTYLLSLCFIVEFYLINIFVLLSITSFV